MDGFVYLVSLELGYLLELLDPQPQLIGEFLAHHPPVAAGKAGSSSGQAATVQLKLRLLGELAVRGNRLRLALRLLLGVGLVLIVALSGSVVPLLLLFLLTTYFFLLAADPLLLQTDFLMLFASELLLPLYDLPLALQP